MTISTPLVSSKPLAHRAYELHGEFSLRKLGMAKYKYRTNVPLKETWNMANMTYEPKRVQFAAPLTMRNSGSKPKKSVRFATTASVRFRSVVTKEELQSMWYQQADYASFDRERRDTISAVKHVNGDLKYLNPETYCIRGLEQQLTRQQSMERRMNAMRCKRVVLEQQYYQRYSGIFDPDSLKVVSKMFSGQASKRAHLRAVIDHALAA